jgi:hypothetical protein
VSCAGVPTLVVSGRHDPIAPTPLGRRIADGIPGATFVEMADAAHEVRAGPLRGRDQSPLRAHFAASALTPQETCGPARDQRMVPVMWTLTEAVVVAPLGSIVVDAAMNEVFVKRRSLWAGLSIGVATRVAVTLAPGGRLGTENEGTD